jgi:hypothetical protein
MSARDAAIDRLATTLGLDRADAAELVDRLTAAAATEATARVADALETARRALSDGGAP